MELSWLPPFVSMQRAAPENARVPRRWDETKETASLACERQMLRPSLDHHVERPLGRATDAREAATCDDFRHLWLSGLSA